MFFFFVSLKCMVVLCLIFCWILHPKVFMLFFVFHCIAQLGAALFLLLPSFLGSFRSSQQLVWTYLQKLFFIYLDSWVYTVSSDGYKQKGQRVFCHCRSCFQSLQGCRTFAAAFKMSYGSSSLGSGLKFSLCCFFFFFRFIGFSEGL